MYTQTKRLASVNNILIETPPSIRLAPFAPPLLVPASGPVPPLLPLLFASAVGSMFMLCAGFVTAVVAYVWVVEGSDDD